MIADVENLSVYEKISIRRSINLVVYSLNIGDRSDIKIPLAFPLQLAIRDIPTYHVPQQQTNFP